MAGYRPGPEVRDSRGPQRPRRTPGPYGPREDPGPAAWPGSASRQVRPAGSGAPPWGPAPPPWEQRPASHAAPHRDPTGGADGNERLTAATGALLLVLFAAEGLTILAIHQLITWHFFLGMLLIGPAALKAASVCYRFARYYTGAREYWRKGPPAPLLRLLGPFVLATSAGVLGTGVMLAVTGSAGQWLFLHKAFFVLWFGAMTIHVLAYVWRLPRLIGADLRGSAGVGRAREVLAGRWVRWLLLAASLAGGLILALATVHLAAPWTGFHQFGG